MQEHCFTTCPTAMRSRTILVLLSWADRHSGVAPCAFVGASRRSDACGDGQLLCTSRASLSHWQRCCTHREPCSPTVLPNTETHVHRQHFRLRARERGPIRAMGALHTHSHCLIATFLTQGIIFVCRDWYLSRLQAHVQVWSQSKSSEIAKGSCAVPRNVPVRK